MVVVKTLVLQNCVSCLDYFGSMVFDCLLPRFGECGWRAVMSHQLYKTLFHMRSPPIVKSMYRQQKENEMRRAKARARLAARVDNKTRTRVSFGRDIHVRETFAARALTPSALFVQPPPFQRPFMADRGGFLRIEFFEVVRSGVYRLCSYDVQGQCDRFRPAYPELDPTVFPTPHQT